VGNCFLRKEDQKAGMKREYQHEFALD